MFERGREKIRLDLNVCTFHSLGLSVIGQVEGKVPSISELSTDKYKLTNAVLRYIENRCKNKKFLSQLNSYFAFHNTPYRSVFEFKNEALSLFLMLKKHLDKQVNVSIFTHYSAHGNHISINYEACQ